jgi:hypothetical protein
MKIDNIKEFTKRTKASKSTIYRFYKRNTELWNETKIKGNKRYFPAEHAKYFDSEIMFDENKVLVLENKSMRNVIDCLMDKDSLQTRLWYMDWTFFITVAYKSDKSKKNCFRTMHSLYEHLSAKYGEVTELRIFFTTEPFANRTGYHNHFVLFISNEKLQETVLNDVQEFFSFDRVDCRLYDKYKAGLFYVAKLGLINEDWDILVNNKDSKMKESVLSVA